MTLRTAIAAAALVLLPHAAFAQAPPSSQTVAPGQQSSTLRVTRDRATIWSRNPSLILAVVERDTLLLAVSKDAQWYEVYVPEAEGGKGETGFVYEGHVELVSGPPPPPRAARPAATRSSWDDDGPRRGRDEPRAPAAPQPLFGIRGFGSATYFAFQASDSFDAILDRSGDLFYGGGAQVIIWRRLFVNVGWERYSRTGERAIVIDDEVFRLGIEDKIEMQPFAVTAGWRFATTDRITPYLGGGIGSVRFKETSPVNDPDENSDERFTSYHALAGVEYQTMKFLFVAFEFQYTSVPDAIGAPGIAGEFDESNLGGLGAQIKILVGR